MKIELNIVAQVTKEIIDRPEGDRVLDDAQRDGVIVALALWTCMRRKLTPIQFANLVARTAVQALADNDDKPRRGQG